MLTPKPFSKSWKSKIALLAAVALCAPIAHAQQNNVIHKKFIEAGWDKPDTARLRANLAEMEKTPFDGVIIGVTGKNDEGKTVQARAAFTDTPWKKAWFQSSIDDLKAIHSKRLTDNLIQVGANPGNVDWFDDAGWKQIVDHMRIVAEIAKEGHLKGILFDPEAYSKPYMQFNYAAQAQRDKHTFEQYQVKARQRGKEVIAAVASVDPNLLFYTFFMNSVNSTAIKTPDPQTALQTYSYNLYPAFINGWLDAAPPTMIFVDGCEGQGYHGNSQLDFLQTANLIRNTALNLIAPENRQKYLAQVQVSFGLYLDAYVNPPTSPWYIDPKGVSPTQRLQINAGFAAESANEYVWVYGEKYRWWPTPNGSVNPESWEDKLPGVTNALLAVSHPDIMAEQIIASLEKKGKLENLLLNGDFSSAKTNTATTDNTPPDWKTVGAPASWSTWQLQTSTGTFSQDNSVSHGNDKSGSARLAGVENGCIIQSIDVKPGESYVVQAWNRQVGQGNSWIRVRWQTADNKWTDQESDVLLFAAKNKDQKEWQKIQGVATVPAEAGKLVVLLSVANQPTAQDVAWYDDAHVYKIQ